MSTPRSSAATRGSPSASPGTPPSASSVSTARARPPAAAERQARLRDLDAARDAWRAEHGPRLVSTEQPIHQARMLTELNAALPDDGILVADGGFAAHWSALYWN